jgi:hypothetical protein
MPQRCRRNIDIPILFTATTDNGGNAGNHISGAPNVWRKPARCTAVVRNLLFGRITFPLERRDGSIFFHTRSRCR